MARCQALHIDIFLPSACFGGKKSKRFKLMRTCKINGRMLGSCSKKQY